MADLPSSTDLTLIPADNNWLPNLCDQLDEHLCQIEWRLGLEINNRGNRFHLIGEPQGRVPVMHSISFIFFNARDVVCHPLVSRIVSPCDAYDQEAR